MQRQSLCYRIVRGRLKLLAIETDAHGLLLHAIDHGLYLIEPWCEAALLGRDFQPQRILIRFACVLDAEILAFRVVEGQTVVYI